jgi:hypothetical protein
MCPSSDHEKSIRDPLATVQTATLTSFPSPKSKFDNKFDPDREKSAMRIGKLREQQQKIHELNQHCDKAVAEIRASLERSQGKGS